MMLTDNQRTRYETLGGLAAYVLGLGDHDKATRAFAMLWNELAREKAADLLACKDVFNRAFAKEGGKI